MRAIVYDEYGPPHVLRLEDVPIPSLGDDDVLVRVRASSVNDYDWHLLTGRPLINRIGGLRSPKYRVLGSDVAGQVEEVGSAVTRFQPGDEVVGDMSPCGFGAFAEYVAAPQSALAMKPAALTFEQAAAVPQAGSLAATGMRQRRPIQPDHRVLVNGAGGGVGTFAVQMAKAFGARVVGVDRAAKLDAVRRAGADDVMDFMESDFTQNGETYDLIIDVHAVHSIATYKRSLAPDGICSVIGGPIPRVMLLLAVGRAVSMAGTKTVGVPLWKPNDTGDTAFLFELIEAGSVVPVVDSVFPLEEVPDAFRRFAAQEHTGKIVIAI